MVKPGADPNSGSLSTRLPLIFGVSGHRDLRVADVPQLRAQLSQVFARFRAAYPHTPFQLLTPLAEGADRLAADVALELEIDLLVPLPMKQREYEQDFATAGSLADFRSLLGRAKAHWEIPMTTGAGAEDRTRQYAEVGELIVRHSHVLILFWDGKDNRKVGGTAWVKKRRERWVKMASATSSPREPMTCGPTIQVVTSRSSSRSPHVRPATIGELPPAAAEYAAKLSRPSAKKQKPLPSYQSAFWAMNSFNAAASDLSALKEPQ